VAVILWAESAVPVTIEGFVEPTRDQEARSSPVWQAAWLDAEVGTGGNTGPATPLSPFVMSPLSQVVHLVGSAGGCAFGPAFDTTDPPAEVGYMVKDRITVQIRTLGWPRTVELLLPFRLSEPVTPGDCEP
jgi:hypothetical protein